MITPIQDYEADSILSDDDLLEAIQIAKQYHCIVRLRWYAFRDWHWILVRASNTVEECRNKMPKSYGL